MQCPYDGTVTTQQYGIPTHFCTNAKDVVTWGSEEEEEEFFTRVPHFRQLPFPGSSTSTIIYCPGALSCRMLQTELKPELNTYQVIYCKEFSLQLAT
jgi:hypothetical protein